MFAAAVGWLGMIGTFAAYVLQSRGQLMSTSLTYAVLNAFGGVLCAVSSAFYGAWPSVASNLVWAAVGFCSMVAIGLKASRSRRRLPIEPTECVAPTRLAA